MSSAVEPEMRFLTTIVVVGTLLPNRRDIQPPNGASLARSSWIDPAARGAMITVTRAVRMTQVLPSMRVPFMLFTRMPVVTEPGPAPM